MKHLFIILLILFPMARPTWAGVVMGQVPERVELKEKLGGRLDGSPWSSDELRGKIHVIFYVDPDEKDLNNDASEGLKNEKFPREKFQSFAIINMAATWLPNFAISSALEEKQKQYPTTIYVRDYRKVLVEAWGISDNNSDVLAFDRNGRLIYRKDGKMEEEDIRELIGIIHDRMEK